MRSHPPFNPTPGNAAAHRILRSGKGGRYRWYLTASRGDWRAGTTLATTSPERVTGWEDGLRRLEASGLLGEGEG